MQASKRAVKQAGKQAYVDGICRHACLAGLGLSERLQGAGTRAREGLCMQL